MLEERKYLDFNKEELVKGEFYHIEEVPTKQGDFYRFTGKIDDKGAHFDWEGKGANNYTTGEVAVLERVKDPLGDLRITRGRMNREIAWVESKLEETTTEKPQETLHEYLRGSGDRSVLDEPP